MTLRVQAARDRAARASERGWQQRQAGLGKPPTRRFAIGDPQASAESFFAVLDHHGLLADDGFLDPDVSLVSVGDHFDYGASEVRHEAIQSGLDILAWLACHHPDQVSVLLGNHDLGRVGELASFEDDAFDGVHREAALAYRGGDVDATREAALLARYPALPTAELAARDFAAFAARQRGLVTSLLRGSRLRVAEAVGRRLLLCHAGVTTDYLSALELDETAWSSAGPVASRLNARLDEAVAGWSSGRLDIDELHRSGSSAGGEGVGMFYHRPANPDVAANADQVIHGVLRRRFDPRRLPIGLVQIIGHISDSKCRELLGDWAAGEPAAPGQLRHLTSDGVNVRYAAGLPDAISADHATMIFIDGGMSRVEASKYQLLDLGSIVAQGPG